MNLILPHRQGIEEIMQLLEKAQIDRDEVLGSHEPRQFNTFLGFIDTTRLDWNTLIVEYNAAFTVMWEEVLKKIYLAVSRANPRNVNNKKISKFFQQATPKLFDIMNIDQKRIRRNLLSHPMFDQDTEDSDHRIYYLFQEEPRDIYKKDLIAAIDEIKIFLTDYLRIMNSISQPSMSEMKQKTIQCLVLTRVHHILRGVTPDREIKDNSRIRNLMHKFCELFEFPLIWSTLFFKAVTTKIDGSQSQLPKISDQQYKELEQEVDHPATLKLTYIYISYLLLLSNQEDGDKISIDPSEPVHINIRRLSKIARKIPHLSITDEFLLQGMIIMRAPLNRFEKKKQHVKNNMAIYSKFTKNQEKIEEDIIQTLSFMDFEKETDEEDKIKDMILEGLYLTLSFTTVTFLTDFLYSFPEQNQIDQTKAKSILERFVKDTENEILDLAKIEFSEEEKAGFLFNINQLIRRL